MELSEQNRIRDAHQELVHNEQTDSVSASHTGPKTSLLHDEHGANSVGHGGQQNDAGPGGKTFEDIFHMVGRRGRFQILLLVIVILTNANVDLQNVNTVFTLTTPDHRLGRRPCLILSCIGMLVSAIGSAFVHSVMTLLVARFMAGFFGTWIEFLTVQQRSLLANCTRIVFGVTDLFVTLMAYLLRDWQYLLLAIAWPSVLAAIFCWFMPESPRWLVSKGQVEKAEKEIKRIGKMNGRSVPTGIMRHLKQTDDPGKVTVLQLFGDVGLTVRWIILYINWIVICMSTYGLVFNISNMGGNVFINFAIGGLLDAAACLLSSFIVNKISRKYFYFGCSTFGACACVMTFLPIILDAPNWCVVALSLIGKASIVAAFHLLYTYSAELFPTTHRGIGVGSCSTMSRIGGLVSPYVADLSVLLSGKMATVLPQLVFGTCAIIGSLLVLILPETRGTELPATLNDIRRNPRKGTEHILSNDETTFA